VPRSRDGWRGRAGDTTSQTLRAAAAAVVELVAVITFEWDAEKAASNEEKHGLSFEEASTAFGDPLSITVDDPDHSQDEARLLLLGTTHKGRLVVVVHTDRDDALRLISARLATPVNAALRDHLREHAEREKPGV